MITRSVKKLLESSIVTGIELIDDSERVQKGIAHWDKQNNDVPAPNCMLKV